MQREEAFEFLNRTARGIAVMFGPSCETLIQDMAEPDHPILAIYNGHVSGREVGSTLDVLGTGLALDASAYTDDLVNLAATTPDGRQVKSSTFHLIGEGFNLALGINFDCSDLAHASRILSELVDVRDDLRSALWQEGDSKQLCLLFDQCIDRVGIPVGELGKEGRLQVIALLEQNNAFSYRKAVPYVAQRLGVSRYTIYKYLAELAGREP